MAKTASRRRLQFSLRSLLLAMVVSCILLAALVGGLYERLVQVFDPLPTGEFLARGELLSYETRANGEFTIRGRVSCYAYYPFRASMTRYWPSGESQTLCAVSSSSQWLGYPEKVIFTYELTDKSLTIANSTTGSRPMADVVATLHGRFAPPAGLLRGGVSTRQDVLDVMRSDDPFATPAQVSGNRADGVVEEPLRLGIAFEEEPVQ